MFASQYEYYGSCSVGVAFATITVVAVTLLVALCSEYGASVLSTSIEPSLNANTCARAVTNWLDVGLLPPCVVSSYLVLMCWQALTSNPSKSCEQSGHAFSASASSTSNESSDKSMVANAIIAAFAMTWTSWRTSSAASSMFAKPPVSSQSSTTTTSGTRRERGQTMKAQFSGAIVVTVDGESPPQQDSGDTEEMESEPWQFYCMMCLAGLYMAMVLTDWDSADGYAVSSYTAFRSMGNISVTLTLRGTNPLCVAPRMACRCGSRSSRSGSRSCSSPGRSWRQSSSPTAILADTTSKECRFIR